VRSVQERLLAANPRLGHVHLMHRPADAFEGLSERAWDTVILNSVVQYFPDLGYLRRVLEGAVERVAPGGAIFVGDVRNLPLLRAFHASVQLFQAPAGLTRAQLRDRVEQRLREEEELVIAPAFFLALARRLRRISHVQVLPKRGSSGNELTAFRYDVVIHVEGPAPAAAGVRWHDWQAQALSLDAVRELLAAAEEPCLGFSRVPNARVRAAVEAVTALGAAEGPELAEELRTQEGDAPRGEVQPEQLLALAAELGWKLELSWATGRTDGSLDIVFSRGPMAAAPSGAFAGLVPAEELKEEQGFANQPLRGMAARGLASQLRTLARQSLPEYMVPAEFVMLEGLPLTPNGKVDRRKLPSMDPRRTGARVSYTPPRNPQEEALAEAWAQVLGLGRVGIHDNFFELGGDSILSIQVVSRVRAAGLHVTSRQIFQHQTIAGLVQAVRETPAAQADQGRVTGEAPLTPIQHWFFEQELEESHHFNQAVLLEARQPLDAACLSEALTALVAHHDALRFQYSREGSLWRQRDAGDRAAPAFERVDLSSVPVAQQGASIEAAVDAAQARLDIQRGPLIRVVLFDVGERRPQRLLVVIHHLVVDGVSWRVLLEDLQAAYLQRAAGEPILLPPKTASFREWAELLVSRAQQPAMQGELERWVELLGGPHTPLPVDRTEGLNTEGSTGVVTLSLSAAETRALVQDVPALYGTQVNDPLLAALLVSIGEWSGARSLRVALDGHGREEELGPVDLSRTVGWLTSLIPVHLEMGEARGVEEVLARVRTQLQALPRHGIGHGLLCYLHPDARIRARVRALPQPEVAFNYLGQLDNVFRDSVFRNARESTGRWHSPRGMRPYLFNIDASLLDGQLQVGWIYSQNRHERSTVTTLARRYMETLRELIQSQ
jgi:non-ribosomal peptide synthase protein (TIGR01720 family)